jgi:hypothetical protein
MDARVKLTAVRFKEFGCEISALAAPLIVMAALVAAIVRPRGRFVSKVGVLVM